jgi:hypothetical protein
VYLWKSIEVRWFTVVKSEFMFQDGEGQLSLQLVRSFISSSQFETWDSYVEFHSRILTE